MINKIKKKIKTFEKTQLKLNKTNEIIIKNQQVQFDFSRISSLFSDNEFIPFTTWSISPSTISHILNNILLNQKKSIIELGLGASSLYIAKFLKLNSVQNVSYYCVESDKNWISKISELAELYDIKDYLKIIYAPISSVGTEICYKNQNKWYNTSHLEKSLLNRKFDLMIVDGPWKGVSPFARFSAIPFFQPWLSDNFSIFLDDTDRAEEWEIAGEWKKILKCNVTHFHRYSILSNEIGHDVEPFKLK